MMLIAKMSGAMLPELQQTSHCRAECAWHMCYVVLCRREVKRVDAFVCSCSLQHLWWRFPCFHRCDIIYQSLPLRLVISGGERVLYIEWFPVVQGLWLINPLYCRTTACECSVVSAVLIFNVWTDLPDSVGTTSVSISFWTVSWQSVLMLIIVVSYILFISPSKQALEPQPPFLMLSHIISSPLGIKTKAKNLR